MHVSPPADCLYATVVWDLRLQCYLTLAYSMLLHRIFFKSATRLKITYATVAGLLPRGPGFAPGSVYVGFVVGELALGQVSLRVL
jgi:hypothetical protein